jgi:hypothetical protein
VLEDALRCMVSKHGNDWSPLLGTIEFAHATLVSASTKMSPFQIDTGRFARNPVTSVFTQGDFAQRFVQDRQEFIQTAQNNLRKAQERHNTYYYQSCSNVQFQPGDLVILLAQNMFLTNAAKGTSNNKVKFCDEVDRSPGSASSPSSHQSI